MNTLLNSAFIVSLALFVGACASSESNTGSQATQLEETSATQQQSETDLVQDAQLAGSLRDQQIAMMVREHVTHARQAYADARLLEAEDNLLAALSLNASSTEAISLLEQVQIALGRANTDITGSNDDVLLRAKARGERLQADARANFEAAQQLRNEGDYEASLGRLNLASSIVNGSDLNIDWGSLSSDISGLLSTVTSELNASLSSQREKATRESFNALQQERQLEVERKRLRRDGILLEAIHSYDAGDFDKAISLTAVLLEKDPLHLKAKNIHTASQKSRHRDKEEEWVRVRAERYLTWIEDIEESRVLITDIVTLPNKEHWRKINELRRKYRELPDEDEDSAGNNVLKQAIATQRIPSLVFDGETSLETVIDQLRTFTSIPYVVTPDAIDAVDAEGIDRKSTRLNSSHLA